MHDYFRLIIVIIIIIIIIVTIKITQIIFHLTSRLRLSYISVINVDTERLTEGEAHSRVQLTFILRPLTVIFEEVVGELAYQY